MLPWWGLWFIIEQIEYKIGMVVADAGVAVAPRLIKDVKGLTESHEGPHEQCCEKHYEVPY